MQARGVIQVSGKMTAAVAIEAAVAETGTEGQLTDLVAAAREGDREALERLLMSIERNVYRVAYRLIGDRAAAEDVAQEVFLQICRKLGQLREGGNFQGWVYRIVVNQARDYWRASGPVTEEIREIPAPAGFDATRDEQRRRLAEAMKVLSEKERAALVLTDLEGLDSREAARILGTLAITVRTRASHARKKLRRALSQYYPELRERV